MRIHEYGQTNSKTVLLQPIDAYDLRSIGNEAARIEDETGRDVLLIGIEVDDWSRDLSPWEASPVFGKEPFGGKASETLEKLLELCSQCDRTYYIGGYSLAGLFSLWAAYQTDLFRGVAAASPSLWFPGFSEYMQAHTIRTKRVYLSLGDREEKTKNPLMATVGARVREAHALLAARGVSCTLEWNEGNHFKDADLRTAKAFSRVLLPE